MVRELTPERAKAIERAALAAEAAREAAAAYRAAVVAAAETGASKAEIARGLGVSLENVRKMLARA